MQREAKRNAEIRNDRRQIGRELETDIPEEAVNAVSRVKAHLKRRAERKTKNRWIEMAARYAGGIAVSGDMEKEEMRKLLENAKQSLDQLGKREKEKPWKRTSRFAFE